MVVGGYPRQPSIPAVNLATTPSLRPLAASVPVSHERRFVAVASADSPRIVATEGDLGDNLVCLTDGSRVLSIMRWTNPKRGGAP